MPPSESVLLHQKSVQKSMNICAQNIPQSEYICLDVEKLHDLIKSLVTTLTHGNLHLRYLMQEAMPSNNCQINENLTAMGIFIRALILPPEMEGCILLLISKDFQIII